MFLTGLYVESTNYQCGRQSRVHFPPLIEAFLSLAISTSSISVKDNSQLQRANNICFSFKLSRIHSLSNRCWRERKSGTQCVVPIMGIHQRYAKLIYGENPQKWDQNIQRTAIPQKLNPGYPILDLLWPHCPKNRGNIAVQSWLLVLNSQKQFCSIIVTLPASDLSEVWRVPDSWDEQIPGSHAAYRRGLLGRAAAKPSILSMHF